MTQPIFIVDLFEAIASEVTGSDNYLYGHPQEINEKLVQMSKVKTTAEKRFPLIALLTDFDEQRGEDYGVDSRVSLHFLIANMSRREWDSPERKVKNFEPVLYPIYQQFINEIARSRHFFESSYEKVGHTKTDRYFWGKSGIHGNEGLIFTDILDCIEIKNLKLTVKNKIC